MLFELQSVRDLMLEGDAFRSRHYLERVHTIQRVLIEQIHVLESMSPQDFLEFRMHLAPASGFQSVQFREIEFLCGLKDPGYINRLTPSEDEGLRLKRRLEEPSMWDAFCRLLDHHGLPMPAADEDERRGTLLRIARDRRSHWDEFSLAEALLTLDSLMVQWRSRHVLMVERQIGTKTGTGGSTGAPYLRTTLDKRFFPELWDLRSYL
jgi:tryptophan 2,3-dioxygenase